VNKATFWKLIERANKNQPDEDSDIEDKIREQLLALDASQIVEFFSIYLDLAITAYTYELWAAAYLLKGGGCGDSAFMDFRDWLISQGETVYNEALKDPQTLANVDDDESFGEYIGDLFSCIYTVYKEKYGEELPVITVNRRLTQDIWFDWKDDEIEAKYPKLTAKGRENLERQEFERTVIAPQYPKLDIREREKLAIQFFKELKAKKGE
jgi:hypothetical protein